LILRSTPPPKTIANAFSFCVLVPSGVPSTSVTLFAVAVRANPANTWKKGVVLLFNANHHWYVPVLIDFGMGVTSLLAGDS